MYNFLLEATDIAHGFETELFAAVNLTLVPASSAAIVGRSGCGKSTLLHIFSTFIQPNRGKVTLLGEDLYSLKEAEIEAFRRYDIGIIFQFHYLFKGMSGLANIKVATMLSGEEVDERIFEKLEIKELMGQKIGELSGGQQQRISIARVLSKKPQIIFADEPTGNLDKETAELVMSVLLDYVRENSAGLLLVTHDEGMASQCDAVYKLEDKILQREEN
ncbi:MAG: ABC transporter ATP-binding protein [Campylobacterota bacterium]|nr:ABC transporter ATP-binding protein [Campylobacterota bacterium]